MKKHLILPTLVIAALISLAGLGTTKIALLWFVICAVATFVTYYFSSRETETPTAIEKVAATGWLFIRRVVSFTAAFIFGLFGLTMAFSDENLPQKAGTVAFGLLMSGFFAWVGVYGQGEDRYSLKDDVAQHKKNKERYKWRW